MNALWEVKGFGGEGVLIYKTKNIKFYIFQKNTCISLKQII